MSKAQVEDGKQFEFHIEGPYFYIFWKVQFARHLKRIPHTESICQNKIREDGVPVTTHTYTASNIII